METNDQQVEDSKSKLLQLLRIYPEERGVFVILGLVFFFNSVATQIASVAAVSGFIKGEGVQQIPILWIIDMLVILLMAGLQSLIIDRFERTNLVRIMILGFAIVFVVLRFMFSIHAPDWLGYGMMMIISDQQWLFFPLVFWTLAQDVFTVAQAKRLFSPIASLGFVGRLAGLVIVSVAPQLVDKGGTAAEELLLLNVVVYVAAYFFVALGLRKIVVRKVVEKHETMREILVEGWDFVKNVPTFKFLTISIFAVNLSLTFIEFSFLAVTNQAFVANYQTFYGLFRLGLTVASFVLQGLVTSRLIEKITLKNSFIIMPFALLIGSFWMLFSGAASAIGGMFVPKVAQFTADDSARRSFQAMVPEERRGRVSTLMESYLFAVGVILASLAILLVLFLGNWLSELWVSYLYRGLAVVCSLWALWAIAKMRQVYDRSMLDWRLKRRQRGVSLLNKLDF